MTGGTSVESPGKAAKNEKANVSSAKEDDSRPKRKHHAPTEPVKGENSDAELDDDANTAPQSLKVKTPKGHQSMYQSSRLMGKNRALTPLDEPAKGEDSGTALYGANSPPQTPKVKVPKRNQSMSLMKHENGDR